MLGPQISNEVEVTSIQKIESLNRVCHALMQTKHYSRLGPEGIFSIVAKAKTLNIDPLDALNGGLYCVQGKVEMSSQLMNLLIRQSGHSIAKDPSSNDEVCILHGKRSDNGDTWTESFSIQEAKQAGIYKESGPWGKYPRDMLFARALSRLARQLFPDVIKGCYVEGEIAQSVSSNEVQKHPVQMLSNAEEGEILDRMLCLVPEYKKKVVDFLKKNLNTESLSGIPMDVYQKLRSKAISEIEIKSRKEITHDLYVEKEENCEEIAQ